MVHAPQVPLTHAVALVQLPHVPLHDGPGWPASTGGLPASIEGWLVPASTTGGTLLASIAGGLASTTGGGPAASTTGGEELASSSPGGAGPASSSEVTPASSDEVG